MPPQSYIDTTQQPNMVRHISMSRQFDEVPPDRRVRDECAYGVGTYDRSLFEKPLGHVVQYCAIELMKARELRWYKIGQRPYPSEQPRATDKEFSIAEFKQGFATHLFPQYVLQYDAQAIGR